MINFMTSRKGFTEDDSKCMPRLSEDSDPKNGGSSGGGGGDVDDSDEQNKFGIRLYAAAEQSPDGLSGVVIEKEHMFDKVVTPSDVGKLNRLVIPKQQAEKYFPLDLSTNEKGLLLNFEDRLGKPWRFRYSYWTSSQSYVMTKGWSRFVKEKKLDAGDIVSFQRGVGELFKDRLFIDWRPRPDAPPPFSSLGSHFTFRTWNHPLFLPSGPAQSHHVNGGYCYGYGNPNAIDSGSVMERVLTQGCVEGMGMVTTPPMPMPPVVFQSVPVIQGTSPAKRLRLFGVNMDCSTSQSNEFNQLSSTAVSPIVRVSSRSQSQNKAFDISFSSSMPSLVLSPDDGLNKAKASMSLDLDI